MHVLLLSPNLHCPNLSESLLLVHPPQEHFVSSTPLALTARTRGTDPRGRWLDPNACHSLTSWYHTAVSSQQLSVLKSGEGCETTELFHKQAWRRERRFYKPATEKLWQFFQQQKTKYSARPFVCWFLWVFSAWRFTACQEKKKRSSGQTLSDSCTSLPLIGTLYSMFYFYSTCKNTVQSWSNLNEWLKVVATSAVLWLAQWTLTDGTMFVVMCRMIREAFGFRFCVLV